VVVNCYFLYPLFYTSLVIRFAMVLVLAYSNNFLRVSIILRDVTATVLEPPCRRLPLFDIPMSILAPLYNGYITMNHSVQMLEEIKIK
jgi:hypothetical protein